MNDNDVHGVDQREADIANGVQAPLVNRFHLRCTKHVVRMVAFESYDTCIIARAAFCLSIDDAIALQRTLGEGIARITSTGKGH